jgi:hypothetical protein
MNKQSFTFRIQVDMEEYGRLVRIKQEKLLKKQEVGKILQNQRFTSINTVILKGCTLISMHTVIKTDIHGTDLIGNGS